MSRAHTNALQVFLVIIIVFFFVIYFVLFSQLLVFQIFRVTYEINEILEVEAK